MCIATLGLIVAKLPEGALVEFGEQTRWASTSLVPDIAVGDYVVVSASTIIERLDRREIDQPEIGQLDAYGEPALRS